MFSTYRAIGLVAIIVILALIVFGIYRAGGDGVRNSIERQNNEAGTASDRARSDFDKCFDAGGVFNSATGKCRGGQAGGRN